MGVGRTARGTVGTRTAIVGMAAVAFFAGEREASALDVRFTGDDVRLTVDDAGMARVEHALTWRVSGGTLHGFDVTGIEPEALVEASAPMTVDGEITNGVARVERKGDTALRVIIDGAPKAARGEHGRTFVIRVAYAVDLVRTKELTLDGAMWKLVWTAPVAPEGYDGARVVFDVPAAPTAPRATALDGASVDDGRLVTLRRAPERDELEMERPHVSRAEAATWVASLDPRAFPRVVDPSLRPPATEPGAPAHHESNAPWLVAAMIAGALFGALAGAKSKEFGRACRRAKVEAVGLVPWSPAPRAWGAGAAFGAAVLGESSGRMGWSALAIVAAMILAAHRAPRVAPAPRGPGKWLALSTGEAFDAAMAPPRSRLDFATRSGKWTLALVLLGALAATVLLARLDPSWIFLAPMDAVAVLSLFMTGSRAQLPPDRTRAPVRRLSAIHRLLRRDATLRVAPWARIPLGTSTPDELRLLVLPRAAMPGVVGIEVGVAWLSTPVGYAGETEILVRVRDDSAAAARLVALAPRSPVVTGRKPEERVVRLVPSASGRAGAVALVRRLSAELRDRRKSLVEVTWGGAERRLPPNERLRVAVATA